MESIIGEEIITGETKQCSKCGEIKSLDEFYSNKNQCKLCIKIYLRNWCKNNQERKRGYSRKYSKNNKDKTYLAANKCRNRRWEYYKLADHKKSYRGKTFNIVISEDELKVIRNNTKVCRYCGNILIYGGKTKRCDSYILPVASIDRINNESILTKDNVQIICRKCNSTKSNRTHEEFIEYCKMIVNNNQN